MDLYAHATLKLWQKHPRDMLWFDLYADRQTRDAAISAAVKPSDEQHHALDLTMEPGFTPFTGSKQPPLPPDRLESLLVTGLRQEATRAATVPLEHALRCLATCLENYARYGSEDAICRVIALVETLSQNHDSRPYRNAFGKARTILQKLVNQSQKAERISGNAQVSAEPMPDRVYYVAVLNACAKYMQPVRIRIFRQERDAVACLTEWLKQYGIPYEVWRSLRSAMADEHLLYKKDGLFATLGEKTICT